MGREPTRILVVDDERFFQEAIRDALAGEALEIEVAGTAQEALQRVGESPFAVVVLDIQLPDRSGLEVLRQIRKDHPDLRVVVLSAHTEQEYVLEALRLGACDYLAKPIHEEELRLSVRRAAEGFAVVSAWTALERRLAAVARELALLLGEAEAGAGGAQLADATVNAVVRALETSRTSLMQLDESTGELRVVAAAGHKVPLSELDPVALGEGVSGWVAARGESLCVRDVGADPRFSPRIQPGRYQADSFVVVPLRERGRTVGVLCATDRAGGAPFSEADAALLRLLAQAPRLSGPKGATPNGAEPEGDSDLAREICDVMTREVDPERLLAGVLRAIAQRLDAAPVALYLLDASSGELLREAQWEGQGAGDRPWLARGRGLTGTVLETGHPVVTEQPADDPRFDAEVDTPEGGSTSPVLVVPVGFRGKRIGCLRAFARGDTVASPSIAEVLGAALSAAVRNVVLYRSLVDSIEEVARIRRGDTGTA